MVYPLQSKTTLSPSFAACPPFVPFFTSLYDHPSDVGVKSSYFWRLTSSESFATAAAELKRNGKIATEAVDATKDRRVDAVSSSSDSNLECRLPTR